MATRPAPQCFDSLDAAIEALLSRIAGPLKLGAPLGILGALFMAKAAPQWMRNILQPALQLYVAIPSVVYGYIGLVVLIPFLQSSFGVRTGFGILSASIILAIMILPTILSLSDDALRGVPAALEEASLALGATWWQTLRHVVVPAALPGILRPGDVLLTLGAGSVWQVGVHYLEAGHGA